MKILTRHAVLLFFSFGCAASALMAQPEVIKYRKIFEVDASRRLRIELNVDAARLQIEPNERDNEVSVYLHFTEEAFDYDIHFDDRKNLLEVDFDKINWIKSDSRNLTAELEVQLPAASLLDFYGRIKAGEVFMRLGGLALERFETRIWAGEVELDFDRPNRIPMRWFELNTKVGSTNLRRLGNARFQYAEINNGIGELLVDFSGRLEDDASARVDLDIGETRIYLPEEVGTKLFISKFLFLSSTDLPGFERYGKMYLSENYEVARKKFELRVKPGIGDLTIRYR